MTSSVWIVMALSLFVSNFHVSSLNYNDEFNLFSLIFGVAGGALYKNIVYENGECSEDCVKECAVNTCGAGNTCLESGDNICICPAGIRSGRPTCADPCSDDSCGGNGQCVPLESAPNGFICVCNEGFVFFGGTCVQEACADANSCGDNQICIQQPRNTFICQCKDGFDDIGENCVQQCPIGTAKLDDISTNQRVCYYAILSQNDQPTTATLCANEQTGGTLAIIPCQQAQNFIASGTLPLTEPFWIGVNDIQDEGQYVDVNGNALVFDNWDTATGEPDDGTGTGSQDCTAVFPNANFRWRTNRCQASNRQGLCSIVITLPTQ